MPAKLQIRFETRGFALIAVMWIVLVAGLMLIGVQKAVRVNLATAYSELASVQAHWLARAGLEQAMAVLEDDDSSTDDMFEFWYSDPDSFEETELATGTFSVTAPPGAMDNPRDTRYGLIDHCGRLNVNVAQANQLKSLCELADWQVNSILDWRDSDNETQPGGAEALYYHHLEYPYLIRNGPFRTIRELLLVRGIDERVFAGEDTNLNGILDANEDDLEKSYPDYDNGDGQLTLGLGGLTTVYAYELNRDANGNKRLNVNTANKDTLIQRFNFTDALAEAVVNYGSSKGESGKPKEGGQPEKSSTKKFNSLMDLLKVKAEEKSSDKKSEDEGKVKEITVKWLAEHLDELTLTDDERLSGQINVNTASKEVLMTLENMTQTTAEAIVQRQNSGAGPFGSVGELLTGNTITEDQFKVFAEQLAVRSSVFEIHSVGVAKWGIRQEIVAVVDRGRNPMNILYWYQSE